MANQVSQQKRFRALGPLRSPPFKKLHAAYPRSEIHLFHTEEIKKWIMEIVGKETAVSRQRVVKTEVAVERERERAKDMKLRRLAACPTKMTCQEMIEAIGDTVENVMTSDDDNDD
jgi:hypothetical protein